MALEQAKDEAKGAAPAAQPDQAAELPKEVHKEEAKDVSKDAAQTAAQEVKADTAEPVAPAATKPEVPTTAEAAKVEEKKAEHSDSSEPLIAKPEVPSPAVEAKKEEPESADKRSPEKEPEDEREKDGGKNQDEPSPIRDNSSDDNVVVNKEEGEDNAMTDAPRSRYPLLEKLLSLLRGEGTLNSVLAGYFGKVMQVLVEKRKLETLAYLFKYSEHIQNLLRRCNNKSIAEIVNKLISNEDKFLTGLNGTEYAPQKKDLLKDMLAKMTTNDGVLTANYGLVLVSLIETRQILDYLLSGPALSRIFEVALSQKPPSLIAGMTLLVALNRLNIPPPAPPNDPFGNFGGGERKALDNFSSRTSRGREAQLRAPSPSFHRPSAQAHHLSPGVAPRTLSSAASRTKRCTFRRELR